MAKIGPFGFKPTYVPVSKRFCSRSTITRSQSQKLVHMDLESKWPRSSHFDSSPLMLQLLSALARAHLEGVLILKYTPEQIINDPFLNKGTAFTQAERNQYGLNGLLPPAVQTLDQQVKQAYAQLTTKPTDLAKRQFLMTLFNENHVLFYKLFSEHINEFMPIVYDPTIADTIEN